MLKFLFTLLCAVLIGVTVAYATVHATRSLLTSDPISLEEDPFSVIEQAKKSLPTQGKLTVGARAYIVIDLETGRVLAERDADRALPIASITKLITAATALEMQKSLQTSLLENNEPIIQITSQTLAIEGSTGNFRKGQQFRLDEIFYPLLMVSSNDAAEAVAGAFGNRKKFLNNMNAWASAVGAYNTYFKDPSGLSPQNIASARDVGLIVRWIALNNPEIFDITKTKSKSIRINTWVNPTHLLNLSTYQGGKNGYTERAGRTGVAIFETRGAGSSRRLAIVALNSDNRDADIINLLDYASTR